jgi:hypothetical protein
MSKLFKPSTSLARPSTAGNLWKNKNITPISDEKLTLFDDLMKKLTFIQNN